MGLTWQLYWTLVQQNKKRVYAMLKASAVDAPNKGSVFSVEEFKKLALTPYDESSKIAFPVWCQHRFMGISILLAALRTEQFRRFRKGGLEGIEFLRNNRDENYFKQNNAHEVMGTGLHWRPRATTESRTETAQTRISPMMTSS